MNYESYLLEAYGAALNSPDPSTQNGAVLLSPKFTHPGRIIGVGYNTFPLGVNEAHWHGEKEAKYARVGHAEVNAILDAAQRGLSTIGSTLVCPWAACSNCAKYIALAGVSTLVRHAYANNGADTGSHWYQDCLIGDEIFAETGIEIIELEPLQDTGIQLRRNGSLWPVKKEALV